MTIALRQTVALLVDAYRELNARKLFWFALGISGVLVGVFAGISIDAEGVGFFGIRLEFLPFSTAVMDEKAFYALLFTNFGVGIWLTWIATGLALISTAGIIPDLIAGGAIETTLSKPISRVRLLLTKFIAGLLFVALQVLVVAGGSALVFGVRAGYWEPRILLAVPIVVVFFSYLFCVCTLVGLLTRSTIASLLVTLLFWFVLFGLNVTDQTLVQARAAAELRVEQQAARIERMETNTAVLLRRELGEQAGEGEIAFTAEELDEANPLLPGRRRQLADAEGDLAAAETWVDRIYAVKTVLPKTSETIALLERWLVDPDDVRFGPAGGDTVVDENPDADDRVGLGDPRAVERMQRRLRARQVWWIVGTSLAFEAAVLALCCLVFARRDF